MATKSHLSDTKSSKSATTALLLCLFLGTLGMHRFYVGKVKTGILMLLTAGGLGVWMLVDIVRIACCDFSDNEGKYLTFTKTGEPSTRKLILIIVGSLILAALIYITLLISIIFYYSNPTAEVVQEQLIAIRAGNMEKAYSYMASETTENVSLEDFTKYIQRFPVMMTYKNIYFSEKKIENKKAYIKTFMETNDERKVAVEFLLGKENRTWKIIAIHMGQLQPIIEQPPSVQKIYEDKDDHYVIQYPGDWYFEQPSKHSVMFSGKEGTPSFTSSITIQVMPSKAIGGIYATINDAIVDLRKQIRSQTINPNFIDSGKIVLPKEPKKTHGQYFVVTYTYKNHNMKKMQFMIAREGDPLIYSWSYTTTIEQYDSDLAIAKAMYESWRID